MKIDSLIKIIKYYQLTAPRAFHFLINTYIYVCCKYTNTEYKYS